MRTSRGHLLNYIVVEMFNSITPSTFGWLCSYDRTLYYRINNRLWRHSTLDLRAQKPKALSS